MNPELIRGTIDHWRLPDREAELLAYDLITNTTGVDHYVQDQAAAKRVARAKLLEKLIEKLRNERRT